MTVINAWNELEPLALNEVLAFDAPSNGRMVRVAGVTNTRCAVWLAGPDEATHLVANIDGEFELRFHVPHGRTLFHVDSLEENASVFIRSFARSHLVEKVSDETYTSIAVRSARNPALEHMMLVMKQNEMARQAKLDAELAEIRALRDNLKGSNDGQTGDRTFEPTAVGGAANASTEQVIEPVSSANDKKAKPATEASGSDADAGTA